MSEQDMTNNYLQGSKYRLTHKASVIGVLGAAGRACPEVSSKGSKFYNANRWTGRGIVEQMIAWAKRHPAQIPTEQDIVSWVNVVNTTRCDRNEIVIASTPDKLSVRTAMALTGGAYHEAFHTKYSCKRNLRVQEISNIILPRWGLVENWSKYHKILQEMINVIEDIRIERCGRKEYEGSYTKLADLQDFILKQENVFAIPADNVSTISIITRTFRDVGLGYTTNSQALVFADYKKRNTDAVNMVTAGPLTPMLQEAIALSDTDDLGCIRVAMDVISVIAQLGGEGEGEGGGEGQGKKNGCPKCGASPSKLIVRPKPNCPGIGIIKCSICNWQDEIDMSGEPSGESPNEPQDGESPQFEGFDDKDDQKDQKNQKGQSQGQKSQDKDNSDGEDAGKNDSNFKDGEEEQSNDSSGSDSKDADDKKGSEESKDGGSSNGDKENSDKDDSGDTADGQGEEGSGKEDGSGQGDDAPAENGSSNGESNDASNGESNDASNGESNDASNGKGAGGHSYDDKPTKGNTDWNDIAEDACKEIENGASGETLDGNTALETAFQEVTNKEDGNLKCNESAWRPYNSELDEIHWVTPSNQGKDYDKTQAEKIIKSVKKEVTYLRSRLRTVIRSMEMKHPVHGVPKGRGLSGKFLVDSKISLMQKENPNRAYWRKGLTIDTSMAVAVVLDESGSMMSWRKDASRILVALTEPFDALNFATMAVGFRNGKSGEYPPNGEEKSCHRYDGITFDIFKGWHERYQTIKWRFANTRATGGTPMSDGIQFALNSLNTRNEAHRFLFIVTDGDPNSGHAPIIKRQIRIAKEAGIHIIGVGLGSSGYGVKKLYPDYVHSNDIAEIPKLLLTKLNDLSDLGQSRGKRVKGIAKSGIKHL